MDVSHGDVGTCAHHVRGISGDIRTLSVASHVVSHMIYAHFRTDVRAFCREMHVLSRLF
jgi:hypothetical protein